jgi:dTDP-4-dehydrorhamnose reductase
MTRILVTGANGQLGRSLRDLAGICAGLDFLFLGKSELDITCRGDINSWFQKYEPHYCINCAAYTKVDQAEKTPSRAYDINVKGVENLVSACIDHDTTLIHISTDYVFDGEKEGGYLPGDEPNPINIYGKTKLEGEKVIQKNMQKYFIIRTSWLYSKKYGPNFYMTILDKAKKGVPFGVTKSQRGCPTDAANLAQHILEIIEKGVREFGISHFTDGIPMSWHEFARRIMEENGLTECMELLKAEEYATFVRRPSNSHLLS